MCLGQAGRRRVGEQCCNLRSTKNVQIAVPNLVFSSISSVLYNVSFGFHHRAPKGSLGDCKALGIIHRYVLVSIYLFPEIQSCHCKQYSFPRLWPLFSVLKFCSDQLLTPDYNLPDVLLKTPVFLCPLPSFPCKEMFP